MTRMSLATSKDSTKLSPIVSSYSRTTEDGNVEVVTLLIGTHYNERSDGVITESSIGDIIGDSITFANGKINIVANANTDGSLVQKIGTHSTFMYFWPKTEIRGNCEIAVAQTGEFSPGVKYVHSSRYEFEDLATTDKLIVELIAGNSVTPTNPELNIIEDIDGVETIIKTISLPSGTLIVDWKIKFQDEGESKIFYKIAGEDITRIFKGDFNVTLGECKVNVINSNTENVSREVNSDFIWIFYPESFITYDVSPTNADLGVIKIWDTDGTEIEADWIRVYSKDHPFTGERVVQNGLIRIRFDETNSKIKVYGWNNAGSSWDIIGTIAPKNSQGTASTAIQEIIFSRFNFSQCRIIAKFGVVDYLIDMRKGMPWIWIKLNSKIFRFETVKERFALSSNLPGTNLTKWSQSGTDEVNRGNPLGTYQGATNPAIFTNDAVTDTGLENIDDNWFGFYDLQATDIVGWVSSVLLPTGLEVKATTTTALEYAEFTYKINNIVAVGMLDSLPTQVINGIPRPFHPGNDDQYVKWRSNEAIYTYSLKPFIKRRT